MGEHEGCGQPPSGMLPNGLLPNEAASVIRVLDMERWLKAEERTAELIACIQPNPPSEERRHAVADYVQRLIMKCFPCQVGLKSFHVCKVISSANFPNYKCLFGQELLIMYATILAALSNDV